MSPAGEYFSARDNWPRKDSVLTVFRYMLAARAAKGKKVLELGCGDGEGSRIIAPGAAGYTGVDYKPHWKDTGYKPPRGTRFVEGDVVDLPHKWTGRYDIVVAFEVIEHLGDPTRFAAEAKRVLKPGGTLLVSTPNFDLVSRGPGHTRKPLFEHHRREFSARAFKSFLTRNELDCAVYGLSQLAVPGGKHRGVLCALGDALLELKPGAKWPKLEVAWVERLAKPLPLEFAQSLVAVSREAAGYLAMEAQASARMSAQRAAALSVRWFLWRKNEHLREALTVIANKTAHLADLEEIIEAREETIKVLTPPARGREALRVPALPPLPGPEAERAVEGADALDVGCSGRQGVDFSVILVNFDSAPYIEPCLSWLEDQNFDGTVERIVVNNRSTDGSLEMLESRDDITLIDAGRNLGFSRANNIAIAESRGKYVVCLNFDCMLGPDFLQKVYDTFESNPNVGMISGKMRKLVDMATTMYLDSTGIDFTTLIPADRGEWEYDDGQYDTLRAIFGPSGAAGCYRREALESVAWRGDDFFDEEMFTYCEDIDLAWRLNLAGWRGLFVPEALAFHERGATRRNSLWKKAGYIAGGFSNRLFTILKNLRRQDVSGKLGKLLRQEWRFLSSWCGRKPARWALASYTLARLAWLVLRPSFIGKRCFAQRQGRAEHLDLQLDADFWQMAYVKRAIRPGPLSPAARIPTAKVDAKAWLASAVGFSNVEWGLSPLFRGTTASSPSYIEIHIPEDFADTLGREKMVIDIDAGGDVTGEVEVFGRDGSTARTEWFLLKGGRGSYELDLQRMKLAPGAENVRAWTAPWGMLRLYLSKGAGSDVTVTALSFRADRAAAHNTAVNADECTRLPSVMESRPVLVYAEVSTMCNMNCSMCGRAVYGVKTKDEGLMKPEVFERLSHLFTPGGRLALFGRGETLLHPDFPHFLRVAKDAGMIVCFNTNGKALSREIADAMVECAQDSLTVSCSAGTGETYAKVHCGGTWESLWENINGLEESKAAAGASKPVLYIEFVSQRRNIAELPALVERAIRRGLQGVLVIDLVAHSDALERQRMHTPENAPLAERYYEEAAAVVERLRHLEPRFELRLPADYDAFTKKSTPGILAAQAATLARDIEKRSGACTADNFCLEPWQTFYVRFDGTVAPCVITNRRLGDLNLDDAVDVWNGPAFRRFRERMRSEEKPFECLRCHLFPGPKRYDRALDKVEEYAPL